MKIQSGFTLVELMISMAIIGIIVSAALPAYQRFIARAQVVDAVNSISGLKADFTSIYSVTGSCPVNGIGGFGIPTDYAGKYVEKIEFSGAIPSVPNSTCSFTATFKTTNISLGLSGKNIVIAMVQPTSTSASQWELRQSITQGTVPSELLPTSLR